MIATELAKYAASFDYRDLPQDVIHHAKRVMLDTLACAIGGYDSDAARTMEAYIRELNHPGEATVYGSGFRTSPMNAVLINGAMVRYLDYNDTAVIYQKDRYRSGFHPSEMLPGILAVGEGQHASGPDVIAAIVMGYDLSLAFLEGVLGTELEDKGWNGDTRGAYIMPLIVGKLLGLSAGEMENAVGISASCHAVLGILDAAAEENRMTKNIRFPTMASSAISAALLAKKGFTGPVTIFEGQYGFIETIMRGEYDIQPLLNLQGKFAIRNICFKSICSDYSSQGHLAATLDLVKSHDIRPEDVMEVRITTNERCAEHTGDPTKKYPKNKETADHSAYYLTAIAIIDRQIGPGQFSPEKFNDPRVLNLIGKVKLIGDPDLNKARPAGISEIVTKEGRTYRIRVDNPRGHVRNPMRDEEIVQKFRGTASQYMTNRQMEQITEAVFELDRLDDIGKLNSLLVW